MKWPEIWKKKQTPLSRAVTELLSREGSTITSSMQTPDGKWWHKVEDQPGATIFSRVPRPDKDA